MCLNPKFLAREGAYKTDNYRGKKGEKYSIYAWTKCGNCPECRNDRSNAWLVRNYYEAKSYGENISFVTLSYKDNPYFLVKKDLQDFIKRFRRHLEYRGYKNKVRYFAAGEYGDLRHRPHFHILIYGWQDPNAEFVRYNKKSNLILHSPVIADTWKFGIHSYQKFSPYEIPYISLYCSPYDTIKKSYIMSRKRAKSLLERLKTENSPISRYNVISELNDAILRCEAEKAKYVLINEFNLWSLSLGWKNFYNNFSSNYVFTEYIEDKEFFTPTSWVKKLSNLGFENAKKEMFRREELARDKGLNLELIKSMSEINYQSRTVSDKIDFQIKREKIEDFL